MAYKKGDWVMLSLTTNHTRYPQRVKEALMRDNIVRVLNVKTGGDYEVYINGYGHFYAYADEILGPASRVALFV